MLIGFSPRGLALVPALGWFRGKVPALFWIAEVPRRVPGAGVARRQQVGGLPCCASTFVIFSEVESESNLLAHAAVARATGERDEGR